MRRPLLVLGLLVAVALGVFMVLRPTLNWEIPVQDLQARVDARMPVSGSKAGVDYAVDQVKVSLVDDGKATLQALVSLEGYGRSLSFLVEGTASPFYKEGGFYLRDVTVGKVELVDLKEKHGAVAAIGKLTSRLVEGGIVGADKVDKVRVMAVDRAQDALAYVLADNPVHRLDASTFKGSVASLALRDIEVHASGVTVVLDPFGVLLRALLWGVCLVLALGASAGLLVGLLRSGSSVGTAAALTLPSILD